MPGGHKKGEDVVNNFGKTLENAKKEVAEIVKKGDTGFEFAKLKRSTRLIDTFQSDPRLVKARDMLKAPATGDMNDLNSQQYGASASAYQEAMKKMAKQFSDAIVAQKGAKVKSAKQSAVNPYLNKAGMFKTQAAQAWKKMVASGYDQSAAEALLTEDVDKRAIEARRAAIDAVQEAMKFFAIRGKDICTSVHDELVAHVGMLIKSS